MAQLLLDETIYGVGAGEARATFAGRVVQRFSDLKTPFLRYNKAENQMIFSGYHLNETTKEDYLKGLGSFNPREIIGYPSAIAALASLIRDSSYTSGFQPWLIVTNSKMLFDWKGELIMEMLQAPLQDFHGTAEYLVFHWDNPGLGYRVYSSLGLLESVEI